MRVFGTATEGNERWDDDNTKKRLTDWLRSQTGATLLEVLAAILLIGIVSTAVFHFQGQLYRANQMDEARVEAYGYAVQIMEQAKRNVNLSTSRSRWGETPYYYEVGMTAQSPREIMVRVYGGADDAEEIVLLKTFVE